jgi:hypothetical protein
MPDAKRVATVHQQHTLVVFPKLQWYRKLFFLETFISVLWIRTVHVILMWILIRMFSTVNVMVFLGEIFCYSC